jgi:DNA-binding NtrC family response regulator
MSAIVRAAVKNTRFSRAAERLGCNYQTVVRAAARASDARPYIPGVQRCVENLAAIVVSSHEPLWEALARFDRAIAQAALHVTGGNHCAAARLLQVHRNSIRPIERRGL